MVLVVALLLRPLQKYLWWWWWWWWWCPHNMANFGRLAAQMILLASLGQPSKFQRVSRLASVTARHSSSGCQPNVAALNRGRHLYSAGRPSRWASAHILVTFLFASSVWCKDNTTNMSDIRNIRMLFGNPKKRLMAKDRSVLVCHLLLLCHFCESRKIILK